MVTIQACFAFHLLSKWGKYNYQTTGNRYQCLVASYCLVCYASRQMKKKQSERSITIIFKITTGNCTIKIYE